MLESNSLYIDQQSYHKTVSLHDGNPMKSMLGTLETVHLHPRFRFPAPVIGIRIKDETRFVREG